MPLRIVPVLVVLLIACVLPFPCHSMDRRVEGKVLHVGDGDSISIKADHGARVEVRLANIDAPEIGQGRARLGRRGIDGQPFGREAREVLKAKVFRRKVEVHVLDVDQYGRTVGVVYYRGRDINIEMVREGWAWAYRNYLHTPYASQYLDAEREARMKRLGLWVQSNPQPPWEFRKGFHKNSY